MGWVTLGLRKSALKDRVNALNFELLQISQQLQRLSTSSNRQRRDIQLIQDYQMGLIDDNYDNQIQTIYDVYSDGQVSDLEAQILDRYSFSNALKGMGANGQNAAIMLAERNYQKLVKQTESIFQRQLDRLEEETDRKSNALEAQQQQVEVELAAAQAEYESVSSAVSSEIKSSAIKLSA